MNPTCALLACPELKVVVRQASSMMIRLFFNSWTYTCCSEMQAHSEDESGQSGRASPMRTGEGMPAPTSLQQALNRSLEQRQPLWESQNVLPSQQRGEAAITGVEDTQLQQAGLEFIERMKENVSDLAWFHIIWKVIIDAQSSSKMA